MSLTKAVPNAKGILLSIEGLEKTGKTYLPLATAPEPVAYIGCDRDNSRLLKTLIKKGRDISWSQHLYTPMENENILKEKDVEVLRRMAIRALPFWKGFRADYLEALKGDYRTVVFDSGARAWALLRIVRYGKHTQVNPILYSQTNYEFANLLHLGRASGKVVIIINRIGDEWKDTLDDHGKKVGIKTGKLVTQGFKDMNFEMEAILRTNNVGDFGATLVDEGVGRRGIRGSVFEGDDLTMPAILAKLTGVPVEKWQ